MESMVYAGQSMEFDGGLMANIGPLSVSGGEETSPLWISKIDNIAFETALKESLVYQGLLSSVGRYLLDVKILKVDQPLIGMSLRVTTYIEYTLTDLEADGSEILNETVVAPYTATVSDAYNWDLRLRLANEGSGQANIAGFLDRLSELRITPVEISPKQ